MLLCLRVGWRAIAVLDLGAIIYVSWYGQLQVLAMARIELIDICMTFKDRGRSGAPSIRPSPSEVVAVPKADYARTTDHSKTTDHLRRAPFSIRNLNLTIPHGKTTVILGPSGCGKTTLLKIIAGLLQPDSGEVRFGAVNMKEVPPRERRIGMIFQGYALYPHLTAKTNILSYFLFRKKTPELNALAKAKYQRTSELLGVDIEYLQDRKPATLSGGEKQRVALGRCITRDPALFLLDEPFSNLDQKLRELYRVNLKTLLDQFNITTVYVTHDQLEALILADRLAIMDIGSIAQVGTYEEIYDKPKNLFVAEFLNPDVTTPSINLIDGRHLSPGLSDMMIGVRPEDVEVTGEQREGCIRGTLTKRTKIPVRQTTVLNLRVGENVVVAQIPGEERWPTNAGVWLHFKKYHIFEKDSGLRVKSVAKSILDGKP
jgi:multiple sugar transport system ATP-binding protein